MIIPHNRLTHGREEADAVRAVVESGHWAVGLETAALEVNLARLAGRREAVAVGSGFAALRLSLMALRVGAGDEVVIPAYCCVALPNAVLALGAVPVIADVTPGAWCLDPAAAEKAVTSLTKAIIAVHSFGIVADMTALKEVGPPVIEDCAHGLMKGGMGGQGDVAVTSFYATKLVAAGEGGAVLADDQDIAAAVKTARDYGDQPASALRQNDKITDLCATLARVQLARLPEMIKRRAELAQNYLENFSTLSEKGVFALPQDIPGRVWYRFCLEVKDAANAAEWIGKLEGEGVSADKPVWDWREEGGPVRLGFSPVADAAYKSLLSLPLYPSLSRQEQEQVCAAVRGIAEAGI
ncbi:MAG: aminotransferase class I/II-fold pyridoxal phosphate-dependent enzyme [Alphaproteobacteria bacterium]|jgi:dTDP-4-amino-4,6-dideoxygalactose transaminase|nr:aminotransferase class I/II-fold pyridoxal phosphate-dependent enzyme [Alphaproteobacteria bacterium]|tara:strand:+ start:1610 stop:2668 length:1059 start_codon:yes stop_codon:yes gene_type:complete